MIVIPLPRREPAAAIHHKLASGFQGRAARYQQSRETPAAPRA